MAVGAPARDRGALFERDAELAQITSALADVGGGRGRALMFEAAAGIGKTRLLEAARQRAEDKAMLALGARAVELEQDFSLGLVRQLFQPHLRSLTSKERKVALAGAAGLTEDLLLGAGEPQNEAGGASDQLLHGLYWLTANLAEHRPLLLALDDIHWADAASLRYVAFLLPRLEELPVALLLALRPEEAEERGELIARIYSDASVETFRPQPLSEAAAEQLTAAELGQDPDPEFVAACHEVTAGNPFFLRELLRELSASDVAPRAEAAEQVRSLGPRAVSKAVIVRLARLPRAAWALAAAVSILGDDGEPRHARALADLDEPDARGVSDALARLSILRRGERLSFVHPIVRSAVYDEIAPRERAALHRDAARLLVQDRAEPGRVASHLLATDPDADPAVVAALRAAAREALSHGAPEVAARYLRRALSEPAAPDERPDLVRQLLAARVAAGEVPASEELDESIDVLRRDPRMLAQAAPDLTLPLAAAGRGREAAQLFEQAIEAVTGVDDELALRLRAQFSGLALLGAVDWTTVRRRLRRFADDPPAGRTPAECAVLASVALHLGEACELTPELTGELAERAVKRRDFVAQGTFGALWLNESARVLIMADRLELAEAVLQDAVAEARRRGSALQYVLASFYRSHLAYRQGRVVDAEAEARSAIEAAKPGGMLAAIPMFVGYLVDALVERGRLGEAEAALEENGLVGELPDAIVFTGALVHRGRLRLAQGRTEEGIADLLELGRRMRRDGFLYPDPSAACPWASLAAPAMAARGERDRARELVEEELRLARWGGKPLAIGAALQGKALVEGGKERLALLGEAVDVLGDSYARLEHARAMTELGVSLSRANRQVEARKTLGEAMDLAHRCGATALAQRAREELSAAGARPRRLMLSGVDSLTASERKVAQLAADGLSNPEIAQALFVTRKTVEKHLGNVYMKLNVGSRSELPAAFAPQGR